MKDLAIPNSENRLARAKAARQAARARGVHDPLRYAAYRYVSSCERDLSDEEFVAYQRWAAT